MRGRGRKGPNPLTRTFESNGPDVKIRGTAMHIAEKYQQLARDAQASGDRVMSENYNQHAEHYLRIVAAAQPQQQPSAQLSGRGEAEDGYEGVSNNGAGPLNGSERHAQERVPVESDLVDADSPQPFIEDMPVINQEGQVNGAGRKADADEDDGEEKPRRRTRTPRARAPRKEASDAADGADAGAPGEDGSSEEEPSKPRRRTPRTRRVKATEEAPAEVATVAE